MIVSKNFFSSQTLLFSFLRLKYFILFIVGTALLYYFELLNFKIPWVPASVIGTAVAFYVGFKNNQSYDRLWEARKIWGGIVNDSRTWGMMVDGYVSNLFVKEKLSESEIKTIKKRLIYRHIAWLYQHRKQLLVPTSWEHIGQEGKAGDSIRRTVDKRGAGLFERENGKIDLKAFLETEEYNRIKERKNPATQLINEQSRSLAELREKGVIDDFRHVEMVNVLKSFYTLQGKNERIKKFPLPRQYANMSRIFVYIFIVILPFTMIPEIMNINPDFGAFLAIPIIVLVSWIYYMMEGIGDYSENPFQGIPFDIPTLGLCRTIEIDLREMLKETDLPEGIKAIDNVLM